MLQLVLQNKELLLAYPWSTLDHQLLGDSISNLSKIRVSGFADVDEGDTYINVILKYGNFERNALWMQVKDNEILLVASPAILSGSNLEMAWKALWEKLQDVYDHLIRDLISYCQDTPAPLSYTSSSPNNEINKRKRQQIQACPDSRKKPACDVSESVSTSLSCALEKAYSLATENADLFNKQKTTYDAPARLWKRSTALRNILSKGLNGIEIKKVKFAYHSRYYERLKERGIILEGAPSQPRQASRNTYIPIEPRTDPGAFIRARKSIHELIPAHIQLFIELVETTKDKFADLKKLLTELILQIEQIKFGDLSADDLCRVKRSYGHYFNTKLIPATNDPLLRVMGLGLKNASRTMHYGHIVQPNLPFGNLWEKLKNSTRQNFSKGMDAYKINELITLYEFAYQIVYKAFNLDPLVLITSRADKNAKLAVANGKIYSDNITADSVWKRLTKPVKKSLLTLINDENILKITYYEIYCSKLKEYQLPLEEAKKRKRIYKLAHSFLNRIPFSQINIYQPFKNNSEYEAIISFERVQYKGFDLANIFKNFIGFYRSKYIRFPSINMEVRPPYLIIKNYSDFFTLFAEELKKAGYSGNKKKLPKCPEFIDNLLMTAKITVSASKSNEEQTQTEFGEFLLESVHPVTDENVHDWLVDDWLKEWELFLDSGTQKIPAEIPQSLKNPDEIPSEMQENPLLECTQLKEKLINASIIAAQKAAELPIIDDQSDGDNDEVESHENTSTPVASQQQKIQPITNLMAEQGFFRFNPISITDFDIEQIFEPFSSLDF